ncbi:MAG: Trm112 family protein [Myxococcaceae bacterium]|nr:Trm112 family protein [Myxococcaceae bacterium]
MALNPELKEILACPKCKGDLEFHEDRQEIHCLACRLVYAIEDDIPVLLIEEARPLDTAKGA